MPPRAPHCSAALLSREKNSSGKWLPLSRWPEGGFIRSAALRRSDQGPESRIVTNAMPPIPDAPPVTMAPLSCTWLIASSFGVLRRACRPVVGAHQGDRAVDHHCLSVRDPRQPHRPLRRLGQDSPAEGGV